MKLNIVPARTGATWVKLGIKTFFRQPLALAALFFLYMAVASIAMLVPYLGVVIALMIEPAARLGLMVAARDASEAIVVDYDVLQLRSHLIESDHALILAALQEPKVEVVLYVDLVGVEVAEIDDVGCEVDVDFCVFQDAFVVLEDGVAGFLAGAEEDGEGSFAEDVDAVSFNTFVCFAGEADGAGLGVVELPDVDSELTGRMLVDAWLDGGSLDVARFEQDVADA